MYWCELIANIFYFQRQETRLKETSKKYFFSVLKFSIFLASQTMGFLKCIKMADEDLENVGIDSFREITESSVHSKTKLVSRELKQKQSKIITFQHEGFNNSFHNYLMKKSTSSDSLCNQPKNSKKGIRRSSETISKADVEKRLKAWKRTTIVRKVSEQLSKE